MIHVEEERRKGRTLNERGRFAPLLLAPPTRTRPPAVTLPELPTDDAERALALADLAAAFVAQHGPTTAQALASWLDEAATEVADDAAR
jgi:hypothetical protein